MSTAPQTMQQRWQSPESGTAYRDERFRSARARERDPRVVGRLLASLRLPRPSTCLDVPSGAGRLRATIEAAGLGYVGSDVSASMLAAARAPGLVRADVHALPFQEGAFDVVVACRLLHHIRSEEELETVLRELLRVSARYLIASFWDAGTLAAWRDRVGLHRRRVHAEGRIARSRSALLGAVTRAGGLLLSYHSAFPYVSRQTFLLACRRDHPPRLACRS